MECPPCFVVWVNGQGCLPYLESLNRLWAHILPVLRVSACTVDTMHWPSLELTGRLPTAGNSNTCKCKSKWWFHVYFICLLLEYVECWSQCNWEAKRQCVWLDARAFSKNLCLKHYISVNDEPLGFHLGGKWKLLFSWTPKIPVEILQNLGNLCKDSEEVICALYLTY